MKLQLTGAESLAFEVISEGEHFTFTEDSGEELTPALEQMVNDLINEVRNTYGTDRANQ